MPRSAFDEKTTLTLHLCFRRYGLVCPTLRRWVIEKMSDALWQHWAVEDEFKPMFDDSSLANPLHGSLFRIRTADALFQQMPEEMWYYTENDSPSPYHMLDSYYMTYTRQVERIRPILPGFSYWCRIDIPIFRGLVSSFAIDDPERNSIVRAQIEIGSQIIESFVYNENRKQWILRSFAPPLSPLPILALGFHNVTIIIEARHESVLHYYRHHVTDEFYEKIFSGDWNIMLADERPARIYVGMLGLLNPN